VGGINSSFTPPDTLWSLLFGLATNCSANWSFVETAWPHISGAGGVEVGVSSSSCEVEVVVHKNQSDGLASNALLSKCHSLIHVSSLVFHGELLAALLELLKGWISSFISKELDSFACGELTKLVDVQMTDLLQEVNRELRPYLAASPAAVAPRLPHTAQWINFKTSPVVALINWIFDDVIGTDGFLGINKIMNALTNGTGEIEVKDMNVSIAVRVGDVGNVTLGLLGLNITGLNTWGVLEVGTPVGNHTLATQTGLDTFNINVTFFVNVSLEGEKGPYATSSLYEEGKIEINTNNSELVSTLFLALEGDTLNAIKSLGKLLDGTCLFQSLYEMNFTSLGFNFTVEQMAVLPVGGDIEQDLDQFLSNILTLFTNSFDSAIPAFLNHFFTGPFRKDINSIIASKFLLPVVEVDNNTDTASSCSEKPKTEETFNREATIISFSVAAVMYLLLLILMLFFEYRKRQQNNLEASSLFLVPESDVVPTYCATKDEETIEQGPIEKKKKENGEDKRCLGMSDSMRWWIRYTIPLVIIMTMALIVSANCSTGASVKMVIRIGEREYVEPLFGFSLASSVRDMWKAGIYPLSLLIAIFSGAWPYLKLLLLLFCWFLPSRLLRSRLRELFLMALDALGKWSLIDAFVMVLMLVAFRYHFNDPGKNISMDVVVYPDYGFHTFLFATMVSLALSHIILACHRRGKAKAAGKKMHHSRKYEPLFMYMWKHKGWKYTWGVFVSLLLAAASAFMISGSYIDSFTFTFEGAAGLVMKLRGEDPATNYSLLSIGSSIPSASQDPDAFSIRWIQAAFYTFAFAAPVALLAVLFVLWLVPMTSRVQSSIFHLAEVFNAWSAMEVFILSIIASLLEIEQFSQFILGDGCDSINVLLKKYFKELLDGDYKCFDVKSTLLTGSWLLFTASVIYIVAAFIVLKACHSALHKRTRQPDHPYQHINN